MKALQGLSVKRGKRVKLLQLFFQLDSLIQRYGWIEG